MKTSVHQSSRRPGPPVKRLLLPGVIFVAIITQIPFIGTLYYAFHEWNLMRPGNGVSFNGIGNFKKVLTTPAFWEVVGNTVFLISVTLVVCLVFGLLLALLLNRNFFGKAIVRTMLVTPFFVMPAVSGIVWKTMALNPSFGLVAYFCELFGLPPVDLMGNHPLAMIIVMVAWNWIPFFMLVLLAGLQSVPEELIEASMLDGAGRIRQLFSVIIPQLLKYIEIVVLLGFIFISQAFGEIYVSTNGGPGYASTNLTFYVYRVGFQGWDIGTASAVGVIIVVIMIVVMTLLFRLLRRTLGGELK